MKTYSPTHDEVTQRAREIWQTKGSPGGRDAEIWLEAEQQLMASSSPSDSAPAAGEAKAAALAERVKAETAAESAVEFHLLSRRPGRARQS